jgi:hypothetical protein
VRLDLSRGDLLGVGILALAWIGIWGAWIPHQTASLSQNALYLAEWATFLPEVRFGDLARVPEWLRLAVSLVSVTLAVGAGGLGKRWLRWMIRLAALTPGLIMLPPYPELLKLWWSEAYGLRFVMAAVVWVGVATSVLSDSLPDQLRRGLVAVLSGLAAGLGSWAFLTLRSRFEVYYATRIAPGWGVLLLLGGLVLVAILQLSTLIWDIKRHMVVAP